MIDGREIFTSDLSTVCQFRYQVYVNECGFEKAEDHPGGIEKDEYDQQSIHLYACSKHSEDVVGAARLILGSERSLPIESHFSPRTVFGSAEQGAVKQTPLRKENIRDLRRRCEHQLVRGLFLSLYRDCKIRELTHLFTIMSKGLQMILKRWGISFEQIGPARDYHGIRAPYLINIKDIERSLQKSNPALFYEA